MAGTVNKVILVGRLGKDPEIRSMNNGSRVCNLVVATSESWRDKQSGERRERTEWHRVNIFVEPIVNLCEKHLKKGAKVYVEGQIETRKYTGSDGAERFSTDIVLRPFRGDLQIIDFADDSGAGRSSSDRASNQSAPSNDPGNGFTAPEGNPFGSDPGVGDFGDVAF